MGINPVRYPSEIWGRTLSLPGYMVITVYIYSIAHLALAHWLGKVLIGVNMNKQTVEADFPFPRYADTRKCRANRFFKGDERERQRLLSRFERGAHKHASHDEKVVQAQLFS
ncbi:hypothetical protein WDV93_13915 [Pantoea ananatis]